MVINVQDITYPEQRYCPPCMQFVLVYSHYDDNDRFHNAVIEGMLDCSFHYHEMNNKVFMPFKINEGSDTPFTEIDPDFHFYTESYCIKNTQCDYYIEDTFVDKFKRSGSFDRNLSIFHLNIKSLPKHYDELEMYLDSLRFPFSFIGLTETWLDECKENLYDLPQYVSVTRYRKMKRGGGVSLLIRNHIPFILRNDLAYFDSKIESVFIEIEKSVFQSNASIIIGLVYRMPDSSVDVFNERLADISNYVQKENKLFYLQGDLNIDLFKHDVHGPTSELLDTIYSYNVYPLITKPTRVTTSSATLIDYIFSNNIDISYGHTQGILCTSMSDHFAIFHIAGNMSTSKLTPPVSLKLTRDMRRKFFDKFSAEMPKINWNNLFFINDAQSAFSTFHKMLSDAYNKSFHTIKLTNHITIRNFGWRLVWKNPSKLKISYMLPGSAFIKPDQRNPWIKDQIKITLLPTISHLLLPNFVSCGRACPSHMTQNLVTVGAKLWTADRFIVDPWSMDYADRVW